MRILLILLILLGATSAQANVVPQSELNRPKIGLVLGGGGALGLSHVGVIQRLEEIGIHPDIVVGTSMGAVVGAMYTSGYDGQALTKLATGLNWDAMFTDASPRSRLNFRRKQDDVDFPSRFKVGVGKDGIRLPRGVIQGQNLFFELTRLLNVHNKGARFSHTDRPFRAVATDLENRKAVILAQGDLPSAVFASMAVPGVLPPVQLDGKLLVDGGLANNLPISVARDLGADIIIAVDLSRPPKKADDIKNMFDVFDQLAAFITLEQMQKEVASLGEKDVLIRPGLDGYTPVDFSKGAGLIQRGREAVKPHLAKLQALAKSLPKWKPVQKKAEPEQQVIAEIHVDNRTNTSDALIWSNLSLRKGDVFDEAELARNIQDLYGYDLFRRIEYRVAEEADGMHLYLTFQPPAVGDDFLRFGFSLESNFENEAGFNAQVSYTRRNLTRLGAEWRSVLGIGSHPHVSTEWYQPLNEKQEYFASFKASVERGRFALFDQHTVAIGELRLDQASLQLAVGRTLAKWGELRFGASQNWARLDRSIGFPGFEKTNDTSTDAFLQLDIDTFDNRSFPASGWDGLVNFETSIGGDFGAFEDKTLHFTLAHALPLAGGTLIPRVEASIGLEDDTLGIGSSSLGGFLRLSGLPPNSRLGNHSALGEFIWYRPITDTTGLLSWPLYAGISLEAGNVFVLRDDIKFSNLTKAGSIFLGTPTPLGPVYLAAGITEDGDSSLYLFMGQTF